jgi:hypothetical protein
VSDDLESDPSSLAAELSTMAHASSLEPPLSRVRGYAERWADFWTKLTAEAHRSGALYDGMLFDLVLLPWLETCASSRMRAWRQTATVAAFAIMAQLNEIAVETLQRERVIEAQQQDKKIKGVCENYRRQIHMSKKGE